MRSIAVKGTQPEQDQGQRHRDTSTQRQPEPGPCTVAGRFPGGFANPPETKPWRCTQARRTHACFSFLGLESKPQETLTAWDTFTLTLPPHSRKRKGALLFFLSTGCGTDLPTPTSTSASISRRISFPLSINQKLETLPTRRASMRGFPPWYSFLLFISPGVCQADPGLR